MKVISSEISKGSPHPRLRRQSSLRGGVLTFTTVDTVYEGDLFVLSLDGNNHYYKAEEIRTVDQLTIEVSVTETGYISSRLSRREKFDVRDLLGLTLKKVTDADVISRVRHTSTLT
jgi:hypothetical protein